MTLPKRFKLGKHAYVVRPVRSLKDGVFGTVYPTLHVVAYQTRGRTPKQRAETFWHEITHAVLFDMNDPRWNDEKFVSAFSKRLAQVVRTAEL
jgi:hypothetical protein